MLKNKLFKILPIISILSIFLIACGQAVPEEQASNPMKYISAEDLMASINGEGEDYIVLDVRKVEDYKEGHLEGSYSADVDAANKGGDDQAGIDNLKSGLEQVKASQNVGEDDKYVLLCYSGKSYAQKATDLLLEMGLSKDQIYTLEGGMSAWQEGGDDYSDLIK